MGSEMCIRDRYNPEQMLQIVKEYFGREYGYRGEGIVLSNRYQRSVNSYIFLEDEKEQFRIQVISNQYAERLLSEAEKTETYRGLSKIDILHTVSIPQLARTIPLKGLNLSLEKYRMPDGVIIEVESSSHYLGSFSEKNDSSTNWIEKIMEGVGIH